MALLGACAGRGRGGEGHGVADVVVGGGCVGDAAGCVEVLRAAFVVGGGAVALMCDDADDDDDGALVDGREKGKKRGACFGGGLVFEPERNVRYERQLPPCEDRDEKEKKVIPAFNRHDFPWATSRW